MFLNVSNVLNDKDISFSMADVKLNSYVKVNDDFRKCFSPYLMLKWFKLLDAYYFKMWEKNIIFVPGRSHKTFVPWKKISNLSAISNFLFTYFKTKSIHFRVISKNLLLIWKFLICRLNTKNQFLIKWMTY